jgi:hypothetical protein
MSVFIRGGGFAFLFIEPSKLSVFWFNPSLRYKSFYHDSVDSHVVDKNCQIVDADLFKLQILRLIKGLELFCENKIANLFLCVDGIPLEHESIEIEKNFQQAKNMREQDLDSIKERILSDYKSSKTMYPLGFYFTDFVLDDSITRSNVPAGLWAKKFKANVLIPQINQDLFRHISKLLNGLKFNIFNTTSSTLIAALGFCGDAASVVQAGQTNLFVKINKFDSSFTCAKHGVIKAIGSVEIGFEMILNKISRNLNIQPTDSLKIFKLFLQTKNRFLPDYFYISGKEEGCYLSLETINLINKFVEEFLINLQLNLASNADIGEVMRKDSLNIMILGEIGLLDVVETASQHVGAFKAISASDIGLVFTSDKLSHSKDFAPFKTSILTSFFKLNESKKTRIFEFLSLIINQL